MLQMSKNKRVENNRVIFANSLLWEPSRQSRYRLLRYRKGAIAFADSHLSASRFYVCFLFSPDTLFICTVILMMITPTIKLVNIC